MPDHHTCNNDEPTVTKAARQPAMLPMPDGSKVPALAPRSTRTEYDSYFNLTRNSPNLVQWSQACLAVLKSQRAGMEKAQLTAPDRLRIMEGMITALEVLLENWLQLVNEKGEEDY